LLHDTLIHPPATRTSLLGFSDIVKIRNRVIGLTKSGIDVLRLEGGEPFMPTPGFIKEAMKRAIDANETRYAPSSGIAPLLSAIVAKLNARNRLPVTETNLIVTSGGLHGLFCAFQATVNPGDEVIFFSPYWTPIKDLVSFSGGIPVRVPWADVRGSDDLGDLLRARLTPKTKLIYVNTPANPTGDVLSREQVQSIADFAVANNLLVISDEAYEDLVYEGEHVSIASLPGMFERTLSVYTLSKSYSMTGWRVGYLAADTPWMDVLRKLVLNSINGVSTPTQFAALAAIEEGRDFIAGMIEEYRLRRTLLVQGVQDAGFGCVAPHGAFYLFVDARERLGPDCWKAMETLLERTRVATVPGSVFGPEGEGFLRMSFSTSIEVLENVVAALKNL
jgi:aspartate/methionine/tyrosine aminotransferase